MATQLELKYPLYVKHNPHIMLIAKEYSLPKADKTDSYIEYGDVIGKAYLYIPTGLRDSLGSSWSGEDITETMQAISRAAINKIKAGGENFSDYVDVGITTIKAAGSALKQGYKRDIFNAADKLVGGSLTKMVRVSAAGTGVTLKPNDVLVLDQIGRHTLTLSWDLAPQNKEEGKMVRDIIKNFKRWSQPTLVPDGSLTQMHYPPIFDVFVKVKSASTNKVDSNDLANDSLLYYTDMVMENFTATYLGGANESLFYEDGTPIMSTISVTLRSLRPGYNVDKTLLGED